MRRGNLTRLTAKTHEHNFTPPLPGYVAAVFREFPPRFVVGFLFRRMKTKPKSTRRAPAFQLYADDFLAGTAEMSADEVGGYIRLLCHQWAKGGVPNDEDRAGRMAGLIGSPSLRYVLAKFSPCDDGLLRNARLEKIRAENDAYRASQATSGAIGAQKRWGMKQNDGDPNGVAMATPMATPMANAWPNDGSPSPSPSPIKDKEEGEALEAPAKAATKPAKVRDRNLHLDTLATLTGAKLEEVTSGGFSAAAKALAEIRQVCPDVTPDEIMRRAKNLSLAWGGKPVSANALSKWWGDADKMPQKAATAAIQSATDAKPKPVFVQIKELESQIWHHPANEHALKSRVYDPSWVGPKKDADRAELKALRARLEALQQGQTDFTDES